MTRGGTGEMIESEYPTSPAYSISGRELFGSVFVEKEASKNPGPGQYATSETNTSPKYTFQHRPNAIKNIHVNPGPGHYKIKSTLDKHAAIFDQDARPTIFNPSECKVGPGEYRTDESIGKQHESIKPTEPAFTFTKAPRNVNRSGPNLYYKTKIQSALGKQVLSQHKTSSSFSLSGRHAFGSIYS